MKQITLLLAALTTFALQATEFSLSSPNKTITARITIDKGILSYHVDYKDIHVILPSRIGFEPYMDGFELEPNGMTGRNQSSTWKNPLGERSTVLDHYEGATLRLKTKGQAMHLECRTYDEGFAFRFVIPKTTQDNTGMDIPAERTEFSFGDNYVCWPVYSAQGKYASARISSVKPGAERPLVVELPQCIVAIGEAALIDFARMKFEVSKTNTFRTKLDSPAKISLPYKMPWRYVRIADDPCRLLEGNDFMLNLNEPTTLADTTWIKPGKVLRETTLTTVGAKESVDFCKARGIQYLEFDAGWYGYEYDDKQDARAVNLDPKRSKGPLDLPEVIRYAKEKGIGIWLYVNRRQLEQRLDELLPIYKQWGIVGIKYGFVNVGSQKWTSWLSDAIAKAGKYGFMIDIHDEYRVTGNQRTFPHMLTVEGIGGNEEMPEAKHNAALPWTRFLCGQADYTFCWYTTRVKNTRAHQLALPILYFSPLQFVHWYDKPSMFKNEPELDFWKEMPTVWDDTKAVNGKIGVFATIARRSQERWFVGSINAVERRTLNIPLSFLKPNVQYTAKIYADAAPDGSNMTGVTCSKREVTSTDTILADMAANGGHAIELIPIK
ncbi:MAG: glycoside hydrolase family 97 N-terminal domain-containing protein [bacterium]